VLHVTFDAPSGVPGPGGRADVGEPARRNRALLWTLVVLAVVAFTFILVSGFVTDLFWYQSVDASSVFTTQLWTKLGLLFFFGGLMAVVVGVSMWIAYRFRPVFRLMSPEQASLERYRMALDPVRRVAMVGVPLLLGLLAGVSATAEWKDWLLFRNGTSFGTTDPTFNVDVGFYVFTLPFLRFVVGFLFAAVVLAFIAAVVVHYVYGGIRMQPADDRFSKAAQAQLGTLVGVFVLLKAIAYWLDRYEVTLSTDDFVPGVTYKDANALLPGLTILMWISLICAVLFFISAFRKGFTVAVTALVLLAGSALVVGTLYPAFVQSVQVRPTELVRESPYIQNNINATRQSYGLDTAEVTPYTAAAFATAAAIKASAGTIENIRLLDPSIVSPTYKQLQAIRTYYRFPDSLDIDRYRLKVKTDTAPKVHGAVVAMREINLAGIDDSQRNWANDHLVYTHGFGMVAAYDNTATSGGQPDFFEHDLPGSGDLAIDQPRVYYGEYSPVYSIVGAPAGATPRELDYPTDTGQANYTYTGTGGVPIGSFVNKLMFAVKYQEPNMVLSDLINSDSKILEVRDPRDRVQKVAPWLEVDGDPYPVAVDGKVLWIVDGYTTTAQYPDATPTSFGDATTDTLTTSAKNVSAQAREQVNYIRNSVKATVDAYDGTVTLYQWDKSDPIVQTWMKAFPGSVQPAEAMPEDLLAHVRYPEDVFKVQRQILAKYHVTDPTGFYSGQDFWTVPNDPTRPTASTAQPPYYLQVQMPGQSAPVFSLTTTFAPQKRNTLAAFMAVSSDPGADYGKLRVLQLPSNTTIPGPAQVQNNFESDPVISSQLSLLRKGGSEVDMGNLLSLPVAGGVLYVEPVYIRAATADGYPLLQKVLASYGDKTSFKNTLGEALTEVFGVPTNTTPGSGVAGDGTGTTTPTPTPNPSGSASGTAAQRLTIAIAAAQLAYDEGRAALAKGDFAAYGVAQDKLARALAAAAVAQQELGFPAASPSPSSTSGASPSPSASGGSA
jgi:uncharacterized membrane protein (UPF0182 family)